MTNLSSEIYQKPGRGRPVAVRADNTTRIPAPPPPEPIEHDTTTPAETPIKPFAMADMPGWGEWLVRRMQDAWPTLHEYDIRSRIGRMIADNNTVFLRTDKAVLAAEALITSSVTFHPNVEVLFCFCRDARGENDMIALYRSAEIWGKLKGAKELRPGAVTDLSYARMRDQFATREILFRDLTA